MADSEDPRPSGGVSPLAVTLDADTKHLKTTQRGVDSSSMSVQGAPICLVEGCTPELSQETNVLLRARLRAAALFLSAGYGVFLVAHLFRADFTSPVGAMLLALHVGTVLVLALVGGMMCRHCDIPLRWLRAAELVIFAMPVLFFMTLSYYLIEGHLSLGYFDFQPGPWLLLMFVYAMFIPNTWRRAAVVIGVIAVTPVVLVIAVLLTDPRVADVSMIETWTRRPADAGTDLGGQRFRRLHDRHAAPRGLRGPAIGPVSAQAADRRRRDGRGLSGRAPVDEAALRDQADSPGQGRRRPNAGPVPARGPRHGQAQRTGTPSRSSTTAAPTTARSTT